MQDVAKKMDLILFLKCASLNFGFSLPMLVGLVGHFYKSVEGQLISAAIYDLSYIIIALMASSGASIGFLRGNKVMELFENLNIHTYGTPEKFNVIKLKIEKITTFVYYYCITISVSMMFMSHILDSDCYKRKNKGQASGYVCGQIIPAWFPIEIDYFPWKHLLWLINFIEAAYIIPKMNVFFVSYYGCVILIINRIEHLKKMLKSIDVHGKDISLIKQEFKKCFIYYSEIHRLTDDFNSTIGFAISTSQNALLGSLIAVMEYQVVMEKDTKVVLPLIMWSMFEAVACWEGQCLQDAGESLRHLVYDISWYDLDPSLRCDFKMFHFQLQKSLCLKVPPSIIMNMGHLYAVMKGSYSFLMYLNKL